MRIPLLFVAFLCVSSAASAALRDKYIDNAQLCTRQFPALESKYGIPKNLLAAIASTESGRWHDSLQLALPWPWTINVEGKGYYYDSKSEALREIRKFQRAGKESIDVGCMQVNLKHHPNAFSSLEAALDPVTNTAYAAKFLRSNYDESLSWLTAAAAYHSRTPTHGRKYLALIERNWTRITDRVEEAGNRGGYKAIDMSKPKELASLQQSVARDALSTHTPETKKSSKRRSTLPSMKLIKVEDKASYDAKRKSTMIITPTTRKTAAKAKEDSQRDGYARNNSMMVMDQDVQSVKGVSITVTGSGGESKRSDTVGAPVFIFSE